MRLAVIINPVAGMGGSVGLKGTDGKETLEEARRRGANPTSEARMSAALIAAGDLTKVEIITCGGRMGHDVLEALHLDHEVVFSPAEETTSDDTVQGVKRFIEKGASIIVFAGGDGTARDILDALGKAVPVIGVPSGVKMHSAVFANSPHAAGVLLSLCLQGKPDLREAEVMDVDEAAFRQGRLSARLYGYLLVPYDRALVQPIKGDVEGPSVEEEKEELAEYFVEIVKEGSIYILGPGTTIATIAAKLGVQKTLLGVDAILDGKLVGSDLGEKQILELIGIHRTAQIVVTPIGSQGFILGRGNQEISPEVVRRVGIGNIIVVSSPSKLATIDSLRVDSGDDGLDRELRGHRRVLIGRGRWRIVKVS